MSKWWHIPRRVNISGTLFVLLTVVLTFLIVRLSGGAQSDFLPLIYLPILLAVIRCDFETVVVVGLVVTCGYLFLVHPVNAPEDGVRSPNIGPVGFSRQDVIRALTINLMALLGASYSRQVQQERKKLRHTVEEQEALLNVSQIINAADKQEQALDSVLLLLRALIPPLRCAAIFLLDEKRRQMQLASVIGVPPGELVSQEFPPPSHRARWNLNHDKPFYVPDVRRRRGAPLAQVDPQARSVVWVSLRALTSPIGMLYISSDQPDAFTDQQIRLLQIFADRVGFPLHKIRVQESLEGLAFTDAMTDLFNYRYFRTHLENQLRLARRFKRPLSLIIIDLDGFKSINDRYGHPAGDRLLVEIAKVLRSSVRDSDLSARYGGEEFVIVCPETSGADAFIVAERIRTTVEGMRFQLVPDETCAVTISIGIATYPLDAHDETTLIRTADIALYRAKRTGKNRVVSAQTLASGAEQAA